MRFGGGGDAAESPEEQARAARALGYTAVFVKSEFCIDAASRAEYRGILARHDLLPAEVGAWSNPLSHSREERDAALEKCKNALALAEEMGARCCVNIAGSRGAKWDGPHPANLSEDTFDTIVQTVRDIVDAVRPTRTFYTLETMPWVFPDSADSYARLIEAVDRPAFAVHFDPVNLVNCPARAFHNNDLIRDFVRKLGPKIRSVHCKDFILADTLTVHISECMPGDGMLDHAALFQALSSLDTDLPVMMEHLKAEQYAEAAGRLRASAASVGVKL